MRYLLDEADATVERLRPAKVGFAAEEIGTGVGGGDMVRVKEVLLF